MDDFCSAHPDLKVRRANHTVTKAEQELLAESYGRPKAPPGTSGYHLFCSEFQKSQHVEAGGKGNSDWMSKASAEWKSLSEPERNDYHQRIKAVRPLFFALSIRTDLP